MRTGLFIGFIVLCGLSAVPLGAKTDVFVPQQGFLIPNTLDTFTDNKEVAFVFQNPAGLAGASQTQVKLDTSQDFFGYHQVSLATVFPTQEFTLGLGYFNFFTDDITRATKTDSTRPEAVGTFGHSVQTLTLSLAKRFHPEITAGVMFQGLSQNLDSSSAFGYSADLGVIWTPYTQIWFGAYTQNLLNSGYQWSNSSRSESLPQRMVVSTGYRTYWMQTELSTDFTSYKLRAEYDLSDQLIFIGDILKEPAFTRYNYGIILDLGSWSLQYNHLTNPDGLLQYNQELFGICYRFGKQFPTYPLR